MNLEERCLLPVCCEECGEYPGCDCEACSNCIMCEEDWRERQVALERQQT